LFAIIVEGRETGVCYNDEELELGMRAMPVSVRQHGTVVAAIGLSTLTTRVSFEDMVGRFHAVLADAAARLGQALE
jgi:DNA-binding IclR family transcriptional regulator